MITGVYIPTGRATTVDFLPVHHYEFKESCLYYRSGDNMFITPEVYYNGEMSNCSCYERIVDVVVKAQNEGVVRPVFGPPPTLSANDTDILKRILQKVAKANMSTRMTNTKPITIHEHEISWVQV